MMIKQ
jgi:hypothetical protein